LIALAENSGTLLMVHC